VDIGDKLKGILNMGELHFECIPTGRITYKQLHFLIGQFSEEQLEMDVTVEDKWSEMLGGKCQAAGLRICAKEHSSLDDYHPVLYFGDIDD